MSDVGSLFDLSDRLRSGGTSATEVVSQAVARHEEHDARLHAYKHFDADAALAQAREVDAALARGEDPGPFAGIPVSVKDIYGVDGMPTFAGTPRRLPDAWEHDAWLVERLRSAGSVFVGKTHTVEMAFGGVGMNPNWATPTNPWDAARARIPGGSSAGAGVSLWEGSAHVALGSDTGGSIRIPAAFTGVVGHKTTKGRWPTKGVVQLSHTFDTVGALTRTVEDSVYFFGSVDPGLGDPVGFRDRLGGTPLSKVRIGIARCRIRNDCQDDIGDVLDATLEELGAAGARFSRIDGSLLDDAVDLYMKGGIGGAECRTFLEEELPGWLEILHPIVGTRIAAVPSPPGAAYREALEEQRRLAGAADALFETADVIALPTNLITPPPVSELEDFDDLTPYLRVNAATLRPTCPANLLGLCALSLPVGLDRAGMPVGLQLIAPAGNDEALLGIALAVERELGTATDRIGRPPLPGG